MSSGDRILGIDDDRVVGEIVSALAKAMGLECDVTRDPKAFFNLVNADTNLILLDLVMPEMDGIGDPAAAGRLELQGSHRSDERDQYSCN